MASADNDWTRDILYVEINSDLEDYAYPDSDNPHHDRKAYQIAENEQIIGVYGHRGSWKSLEAFGFILINKL